MVQRGPPGAPPGSLSCAHCLPNSTHSELIYAGPPILTQPGSTYAAEAQVRIVPQDAAAGVDGGSTDLFLLFVVDASVPVEDNNLQIPLATGWLVTSTTATSTTGGETIGWYIDFSAPPGTCFLVAQVGLYAE